MSAICIEDTRTLRSAQSTCGWKIRNLSASQARECGYKHEISICLSHFNKLSKVNRVNCCYPYAEEETCTATEMLTDCPQRLLRVFDKLGPKTGTKICRKHLLEADQNEKITSHSSYQNPVKRKKYDLDQDFDQQPAQFNNSDNPSTSSKDEMLNKIHEQELEIQKLKEERDRLLATTDNAVSFPVQINRLHQALWSHYSNGGKKLYSPDEMEKFSNAVTPGLFQDLLSSITSNRKSKFSEKRLQLQRQRVVYLLHTFSFFQNQKNGPIQKSCGNNLRLHGATRSSLMSGMVMGFSTHPRTLWNFELECSDKNKKETRNLISKATKNQQFLMIIEDDIHFIHTLHHPKATTTSTSLNMATILIDYQPGIPALKRPTDVTQIHRHVPVPLDKDKISICRGGIDYEHLIGFMKVKMGKYFKQSFLESLPGEYKEFDLSNAKKACENLRVYSDERHHEYDLLKNSWLIDEFRQCLHSKEDYKSCLKHIFDTTPELKEYLDHYLVLLTGDYPTWKYNKKLIAEWKPDQDPKYLSSFVVWQGQFHIVLNAQESTVLLFRPFFSMMYKAIFGRNKKMPLKPKSYRIATLISVTFGGWSIVRTIILKKFGNCKDPEYSMVVHLLDEVVPLFFYFYEVIFRGGNLQSWLETTTRIAIQFILFRRRNYDKATLAQISDVLFLLTESGDFTHFLENSLRQGYIIPTKFEKALFPSEFFQLYHLPSFDANFDQRSFPMAYAFSNNQPNPLVCCDSLSCHVESDQQVQVVRLNCGHTVHNCCLQLTRSQCANANDSVNAKPCDHCPICVEPFAKRVKELSEAFNNYLVGHDNEESVNENDDEDSMDDEDDDERELENNEDLKKVQTTFQERVLGLRGKLSEKFDKLESKQILPRCSNKLSLELSISTRDQRPSTASNGCKSDASNATQTSGFNCTFPGCGRVCRSKGGLQNHRRIHKK